ncbi:OmpA family protein [Leptospira yanagawae serovar Saopaulo str. Sao Paulo = ATCC 700523]|uniref:OmpA family protein n=2 Tax=Leptospira yanagawae TaxID=293069 RepID=A0A5E8HF58_9LEPT|nr:OmpA family protein [Leptospira yanagawae serovar Saopaulo str. Sao Paulo = ATCC 700523]
MDRKMVFIFGKDRKTFRMMEKTLKANWKQTLGSLCIAILGMACSWNGIPLEKKKHIPISVPSSCEPNLETRTYRILFLLPVFTRDIGTESNLNPNDAFVVETKAYAKPWDIVVTTLGFLFSVTSSSEISVVCPKQVVLESLGKQAPGQTMVSKFPFWQASGSPSPIQSISFPPDDYKLTEETKEKLIQLTRDLLKSETNFKIVLVGKSHTSGDIAYQTRLVKRRFDEIRQVLVSESISEDRIFPLMAERENKTSLDKQEENQSAISIFLVKE